MIFFNISEYYKSLQNIVLVSVLPVRTFNNVCGQILLVQDISSFDGILIGGTQVFLNMNQVH